MEDKINHPQHYTRGGIECIDYIESWGMDYKQGNIIKYVTRFKDKGGVEDLKKARWYIDRLIEELDADVTVWQRTPSPNAGRGTATVGDKYTPAQDDWSRSHLPLDISGKVISSPSEVMPYPVDWPYNKSGACNPCKQAAGRSRACNHET
jgi:hypothetical protein